MEKNGNFGLISSLNKPLLNHAISTLPFSVETGSPNQKDRISTRLWGVLHKNYNHNERNSLICDHVKMHYPVESVKNLETYKREVTVEKALFGHGGRSFEHFFVDYLARNKLDSDHYNLSHRKGVHSLDNIVKADLVTSITSPLPKFLRVNIGSQVYFKKRLNHLNIIEKELTGKEENIINGGSQIILGKESKVFNGVTLNRDIIRNLPKKIRPDVACLIITNQGLCGVGERSLHGNDAGADMFRLGYERRKKSGYRRVGPTSYLPQKVQEYMSDVSFYYQKASLSFVNFVNEKLGTEEKESSYQTLSQLGSVYRVNKYDEEKERATYDYFKAGGLQPRFLSVSFRVTSALKEKLLKLKTQQ